MRASRKAKAASARVERTVAVRAGKAEIERQLINLFAEFFL
jgi:hypothetical protein